MHRALACLTALVSVLQLSSAFLVAQPRRWTAAAARRETRSTVAARKRERSDRRARGAWLAFRVRPGCTISGWPTAEGRSGRQFDWAHCRFERTCDPDR